jgi:hypothetical protein
VAKQHTATGNGKPEFNSHQKASGKKTKKKVPSAGAKSKPSSRKGSSDFKTTGMGIYSQVACRLGCQCVTCLIARGDRENAHRMRYGY